MAPPRRESLEQRLTDVRLITRTHRTGRILGVIATRLTSDCLRQSNGSSLAAVSYVPCGEARSSDRARIAAMRAHVILLARFLLGGLLIDTFGAAVLAVGTGGYGVGAATRAETTHLPALGDRWIAHSAGIRTTGVLHLLTGGVLAARVPGSVHVVSLITGSPCWSCPGVGTQPQRLASPQRVAPHRHEQRRRTIDAPTP